MTVPETVSEPVRESGPVPIGKVTAPLARELAVAHAEEVGACIRPLAVRRIDTTTGQTTVVPIPCGATRETVCRPCATQARRLRLHQAREGWHLIEEPQVTTAEPTVRQRALLGQRADLEDDRAAALEHGDTTRARDLEHAIDQADALLRAEGIRGTLTPTRHDKATTVRSRRRSGGPAAPGDVRTPPTCPGIRCGRRPRGGCSRPPTAAPTGPPPSSR